MFIYARVYLCVGVCVDGELTDCLGLALEDADDTDAGALWIYQGRKVSQAARIYDACEDARVLPWQCLELIIIDGLSRAVKPQDLGKIA